MVIFLEYPLEYKASIEKLMAQPDGKWLPLCELDLPAADAIQFAVSLWAEGLLEPQQQ